jgi:glycosyl transferase family 25
MKALLASSHEFGLVLEDDVVVGADTPAVLAALGAQVDAWDVVKLSGIHSGSPRPVRTLGAGRDLCVMLSRCTGASAYVVNRRAAQVYLDKLLPMQLPYDHAQDRGWALGLKVRKVHPVVCTHSYDQGSTIDVAPPKGHRTQAARLPWYRRLSVYRYRLGNELSRLAHGLFTWWRERASARAG